MSTFVAKPTPRRVLAAFFVVAVLLAVVGLTYEHYLPVQLVKLAVAGLFAGAAALFIVSYPRFGLLLGVFYVFAGLAFYFRLPVPYAIMTLVLGATMLRYFRGDTFQLTNEEFNWSFWVFTLICITSITWAHDPGLSLVSLSQLLKVGLTTYLAVQLLRTPRDLEWLLLTVMLGAVAAVCFGALNLRLGIDAETTTVGPAIAGIQRFAATFPNSNNAALFLLTPVPLTIFLIKRARRWMRFVYVVAVLVLIAAVVLTFSRGALAPLLIVLLATFFKEARSRRAYVFFSIAFAIGILLTPPIYWLRLLSIGDLLSGAMQDWSFYLRFLALETGIALFLAHPLTGVGLYNFTARCGNELFVPLQTHNTFLEVAVGVGVLGLIAYLAIHLSGVLALLRTWRHDWGPDLSWMRDLAFYVGLAHVTVLCGAVFQSIEFYQMVWLPIAAALVASNLRKTHPAPSPQSL